MTAVAPRSISLEHFLADQLLADDDWTDQRGHAEYEQDVVNIAPHYAADGDIRLSRKYGLYRDCHFRRIGSERHHGQADDEGRYAERQGYLRSASDE